jgi:hypothetical protein
MPTSSVQQRLRQLSVLNGDLSRLLDNQSMGLDSTDESFFDNVEESIIGPLYAEFAKSWGPVCA